MKIVKGIALLLVVIGALNWGLWGFFQFDLVAWLFNGNTSMTSRVIYALVGLAGVSMLCCLGRCCKAMCCGSACAKCEDGCKCGSKCKCGPNCKCCK